VSGVVEAVTSLQALVTTAGIVAAGALTPGPNNLIVLDRAARAGFASTIPAIAAITAGSVTLALLAATSGGLLLGAHGGLRAVLLIAASVYLGWLGLRLLTGASGRLAAPPGLQPAKAWQLFGFQFANPKAWVIALAASTALEAYRSVHTALLDLALLFGLIPAACLLVWSSAGAWLSRHLEHPHARRALDRLMGALLLGSALALVL
jgi:threonine/homoserine/homoserine lactone efflux protein